MAIVKEEQPCTSVGHDDDINCAKVDTETKVNIEIETTFTGEAEVNGKASTENVERQQVIDMAAATQPRQMPKEVSI